MAVKEDPESPSREQGLGPVFGSTAASGAAREPKRRRLGYSAADKRDSAEDVAGAAVCGAEGCAAGHGATAGTGEQGVGGDAAGAATAALAGPGGSRPLYVGHGTYRKGRLYLVSGAVEGLWPHLWDQLQADRRAARARRRPGVRNETTAERDLRVFVQQREWAWVDGQQVERVAGAQAVDLGLRYQAGWCLTGAKHVLTALGLPLGLRNRVEEPRLLLARLPDGRVVAGREADEGQDGWWELPGVVGKEEAEDGGVEGGGVVVKERKQQQQQQQQGEWDGDDDTEGTEIGTDEEMQGDELLQQAWGTDGVDTEGTEYCTSSEDMDGEEEAVQQQQQRRQQQQRQQRQKDRGRAAVCSQPTRLAAAGAADGAHAGPAQEAPEAIAGGRPHGIRHSGRIYASALLLRNSAVPDLWPDLPDVPRCEAKRGGVGAWRGRCMNKWGGLGYGYSTLFPGFVPQTQRR